MKLPKVVSDLITAQANFDSTAYAACFSETAVVFDEGKTYQGRQEIEYWIRNANEQYRTVMIPLSFEEKGTLRILKAAISGTFDGSPIQLNYHFELVEGRIQSLKITG